MHSCGHKTYHQSGSHGIQAAYISNETRLDSSFKLKTKPMMIMIL